MQALNGTRTVTKMCYGNEPMRLCGRDKRRLFRLLDVLISNANPGLGWRLASAAGPELKFPCMRGALIAPVLLSRSHRDVIFPDLAKDTGEGPMRYTKFAGKSAIGVHWFMIAIALLLAPAGALAQAGSAGGNVGKQDKSVSGGQDVSAKPPATRNATPKPSRTAPARREAGPPAASGSWKGVSTGHCIPSWRRFTRFLASPIKPKPWDYRRARSGLSLRFR